MYVVIICTVRGDGKLQSLSHLWKAGGGVGMERERSWESLEIRDEGVHAFSLTGGRG